IVRRHHHSAGGCARHREGAKLVCRLPLFVGRDVGRSGAGRLRHLGQAGAQALRAAWR
ncbi:hypothetical protein LTR94_038845, partial [Friedmanniomyces endolithicus]